MREFDVLEIGIVESKDLNGQSPTKYPQRSQEYYW